MGGLESCAGETSSVPATGTWQAPGAFVIGRRRSGGAVAAAWRGSVDAVHAYARVLSTSDICQLALQ
jgi:hypothetical protein